MTIGWEWTTRAAPIVQIGIGDSRIDTPNIARWDLDDWDAPTSTWTGTEPVWVTVTGDTHKVTFELGRKRATDRFEPGRCTITVSNESGWADPNIEVDPEELTLRAGRPVRVLVDHEVHGLIVKFRGYIDGLVPRYDPVHSDVVDISAVCALGESGRAQAPKLAAPVGSTELAGSRIIRILDAAKWPAGLRAIESTGVSMLGTELGDQVGNLMGKVVDSVGGAVFGDTLGRVAFKGKDWQTFNPFDIPDDTIGTDRTQASLGVFHFPEDLGFDNYLTVPIDTPVGAESALWMVECIRPPNPPTGRTYFVSGNPWSIIFNDTGVVVRMRCSDGSNLSTPTALYADLEANGFPAVGMPVQLMGWFDFFDLLVFAWRPYGRPLTDLTEWNGTTSVAIGVKMPTDTVDTWHLGSSNAGTDDQFIGDVFEWYGKAGVSFLPTHIKDTDIVSDTDPLIASSGQTVTIHRRPTLGGYIDYPGTAGNYASVPMGTLAVDASAIGRVDCVRPPNAPAGTLYRVSGAPLYLTFGETILYAQIYCADAVVRNASATYAALEAAGFPLQGERVHIQVRWDAPTDTLYLEWRKPVGDLAANAGFTVGASAVHTGQELTNTYASWIMGGTVAVDRFIGKAYRWMSYINGALRHDIDPMLNVTGDTATFVCTTGQTVTTVRTGSPDLELVPADPTSDFEMAAATYTEDVWPSTWDLSHQRRDTVTQVELARETDVDTEVYDDLVGQKLYGIETWKSTDLVCWSAAQLDRLADRILRTRGWTTANRVERVRIDASTSDRALDLCTLLDPFKPSRYRCRLELERGIIFDREMFATGVRHTMTPYEWTVDINLDVAEPWASSGGRWDEASWDLNEWSASL